MDKRSFQNVIPIFSFDIRLIYFIGFHSVAVYFIEDALVLFLQGILKYTELEALQRQKLWVSFVAVWSVQQPARHITDTEQLCGITELRCLKDSISEPWQSSTWLTNICYYYYLFLSPFLSIFECFLKLLEICRKLSLFSSIATKMR